MSETPKFGGAADDKTRSGSSGAKSRVEVVAMNLTVNGQRRTITIEPRTTLLDALRENLALTGTKKACDRGECGACTVHIDGRRVLSCMTLAAMQEGKRITTIEGLEQNGVLHPLQSAFIEHDGFQCGFCTSGQIMSGVAIIAEAKAGWPSAASADVRAPFTLADLSHAEIRERIAAICVAAPATRTSLTLSPKSSRGAEVCIHLPFRQQTMKRKRSLPMLSIPSSPSSPAALILSGS
jgi:xanthine dehydrogenase YagT iron-sulfur-binding subunit